MHFKRLGIALALLAAVVLGSCATPPAGSVSGAPGRPNDAQVDLRAEYVKLEQAGGKLFTLSPQTSSVRIYAFRAGSAARLGHNHVISAPRFAGFFHLPAEGPADARFDLEFRLDQLEIDDPAVRASLGSAFASVPTPEAIASTREHMLGDDGLQAARYPFVRIHSLLVSGEAPKFAAKVRIEMHGQAREMWVPLTVLGLPDRLSVSGSLVLRQTDFGARPYSVLGGMLAVQDAVVIEFQLVGM